MYLYVEQVKFIKSIVKDEIAIKASGGVGNLEAYIINIQHFRMFRQI